MATQITRFDASRHDISDLIGEEKSFFFRRL
jgi:hypothetical protein